MTRTYQDVLALSAAEYESQMRLLHELGLYLPYFFFIDKIILMNEINLKNVVWKEDEHYVSWNLNTGVSSFGDTKKEALESLEEALELHLEDVPATKVTKVEKPDLSSLQFRYA